MERKYSVHSCPVGYSLGHDGDECRVTSYQDGTAFCRTCNTLYPAIAGHHLVRDLLSAFARVACRHSYDKPPAIEVVEQHVCFLQPLDSSERNMAALIINLDTFDPPELLNASKKQASHATPGADVPQSVMDTLKELQELGISMPQPMYPLSPPVYSTHHRGMNIILGYYPNP